ncbi:MAG: tRNA (adenosine(37)-N6)-dimethylallyltransferase MiaA [Bacilli bacterium]|nr:tRNA (adenosine(37)-N6)-dimethylallyltransferase MiaA [Bacilli bacterium]
MNDIIVIVGPTGVGKTKLSIELAKKIDAEVINGDSVSIYKKLNIGSAKPSKEEMNGIVHHLIDIRDVNEDYTVYDYQKDCRDCIKDIESRDKRVIIVGGTGLYIKASLYDYRFSVENNYSSFDDLTNEEILEKIRNYDEKIDVHVNNRQRLVRLLNKFINNSLFSNDKDKLLYNIKVIGLTTDRNIIYDRINDRVDKMLEDGLLSEVESLKDEYETSRILNSGIGYKEFKDYLFGDKKLEDVINEIKKDSRHFAKRQYTFFNNQFDVKWFDVDFLNFNNTINEVYEYIKE